jgi:hypothetical protein
MRTARFRNLKMRPQIGPARTSDGPFLAAISVLGLAMLALLAVLLLADVVGPVELSPLLVLAAVLFVVAAGLVWRWAVTEAELAASHAKVDQGRDRERGNR